MPAKTRKLPEDASQKSPTQTELKKMTRADFVEFITNLYTEDDSFTMSEIELNNTIDFLKKFHTNPPDMAESLQSRGTPDNPLMTPIGLAHHVNQISEGKTAQQETKIKEKQDQATQIKKLQKELKQNKKSAQATKQELAFKEINKEIEKLQKSNKMALEATQFLYMMNYFQQESTKLELCTASKYIIYKPPLKIGLRLGSSTLFQDVRTQQRKNPTDKTDKNICAQKAKILVDLVFPNEEAFQTQYDEISAQLMENSIEMMTNKKIPLCVQMDAESVPNAYLIPAMNKTTFVEAVKYLQVWTDDRNLQETLEFSIRLFSGCFIANHKTYKGMEVGNDEVRSEHINNVVKLSDALVNKTQASETTACRLIEITEQTPVASLHQKFAHFTVHTISYLAMMQDFYAVNAYATKLKESLTAKEEKSEKDEKHLQTLEQDRKYLENAVYLNKGQKLTNDWKEIQSLASDVEKYKAIAPNNEKLLTQLTADVTTHFGLNRLALHAFDNANLSTNAVVAFESLHPEFTWDEDMTSAPHPTLGQRDPTIEDVD